MPTGVTPRQNVVLAALAVCPDAAFAPVQIQKMFFLLDEAISSQIGGKQFSFEPYDYGPFDKCVYQELEALSQLGFVEVVQISPGAGGRRYRLTNSGEKAGASSLDHYPEEAKAFMQEVSRWTRRLSFAQLVGSIYQAFPNMRARSIFVE